MPKKIPKGVHYRLVHFYARAQQPRFVTQDKAMQRIKARGIQGGSQCFTELWKMTNEDDGERIGLYENDAISLTDE